MNAVSCAAIRDHDGTVYSVPRPGRHHDVIKKMVQAGRPIPIRGEQGFLLDDGSFVDRKTARVIADTNGQAGGRRDQGLSELFSEDLW